MAAIALMIAIAPGFAAMISGGMHADARMGGPDMSARAHAVLACTGACSDRADMRAAIDAVTPDTRTAAGNRTDMGAGAHTVFADMRTNAHPQHVNAAADVLGAGCSGTEQSHREDKANEDFHGILQHASAIAACDVLIVPGDNWPRYYWVPCMQATIMTLAGNKAPNEDRSVRTLSSLRYSVTGANQQCRLPCHLVFWMASLGPSRQLTNAWTPVG
jgi:hypothetical protein